MPRASDELRALFPGMDREALDAIALNFTVDRGGVIRKKIPSHKPTQREWNALLYLFLEWDYAYESKKN